MSITYHYSMEESREGKTIPKEVKGILSFIDRELLFEYKVYDVNGNSLSNLSKFSIQLDQIRNMVFKKRPFFLGAKISIQAKHNAFLEPLPGSREGGIELFIRRADQQEARRFTKKMNFYRSGETNEDPS